MGLCEIFGGGASVVLPLGGEHKSLKLFSAGVCLICGSQVLGSASFPSNLLVVVDVGGCWEQKVMYRIQMKGKV